MLGSSGLTGGVASAFSNPFSGFGKDQKGKQADKKKSQKTSDKGTATDSQEEYSGIVSPNSVLGKRFLTLFAGYTHSQDGKVGAVVCILDSFTDKGDSRDKTVELIRAKVKELSLQDPLFEQIRVTGEPVMIADSFRMIERDGIRLGWSSSVLLMLVILIIFRSIRWMLIPVLVIQVAFALTQSVLVASQLELTMVSSMMNAIIAVIGVASTIHIIVRFRIARRAGATRRIAMRKSLMLLLAPIFWAIMTDIVGFASLLISNLGPVHDFSLMMITGCLMVWISILLIVPGLALLPLPGILRYLDFDPVEPRRKNLLDDNLALPLNWAQRHPFLMMFASASLTLLMAIGISFSEVESDFTKNFRAGSDIAKSYNFVENRLGGAGVWDVMIPAPPSDKINWAFLKKVDKLENRLRTEVTYTENGTENSGLTKVISLTDAVKSAMLIDPENIPFGRDRMIRFTISMMEKFMQQYMKAMYSFESIPQVDTNQEEPTYKKQYYFRIMLRSRERLSSRQKSDIVNSVNKICREEMGEEAEKVVTTGYFVLIANMIESVIRDQWSTFLAAILGILLMLTVATSSVRFALIGIVPNLLPILMMLGFLGWVGVKVNLGVALIAAVSMGLSVDSSIHYILFFQRAKRQGKSNTLALSEVQNRVGRALVISTLAIMLGFSTLIFSPFIPIVSFGQLSILAMFGGLLGNLIVLPVLLSAFTKETLSQADSMNSADSVDSTDSTDPADSSQLQT